jgi:hypothetical protein
MEFSIQFITFLVMNKIYSSKNHKAYQTLDSVDYQQSEIKHFLLPCR